MNFPRISEKKFAGLSLVGSIVIIITTSIWFYQVGPEGFDSTLIAGMLMLGSANLVYALFYRRLRPATLAGSLWATAIVWVWYSQLKTKWYNTQLLRSNHGILCGLKKQSFKLLRTMQKHQPNRSNV